MVSCSIILSWFRLGFRGLSRYSFGILFHHHVLVPATVPGLVSVSFGILFHHHSWFRLGFRGLSPYSSGAPFHHPFLVVASVPGLVAPTALELNGVLNSFKKQFCSTGIVGYRVVFFSILAFCSIIISSILLFSGRVPGLSPQSSGILFHLHFLVPGRVPGVVSLVFWHSVPSSCRGSIWFQEGLWGLSPLCCGIVFHHISSFLLVPARVPFFFLTFLFFLFSGRGLCSIVIFWFCLVPGSGSGACLPSFLSFLFSGMGRPMNSLFRMNVVETWFVAVWGLCWCNFFWVP